MDGITAAVRACSEVVSALVVAGNAEGCTRVDFGVVIAAKASLNPFPFEELATEGPTKASQDLSTFTSTCTLVGLRGVAVDATLVGVRLAKGRGTDGSSSACPVDCKGIITNAIGDPLPPTERIGVRALGLTVRAEHGQVQGLCVGTALVKAPACVSTTAQLDYAGGGLRFKAEASQALATIFASAPGLATLPIRAGHFREAVVITVCFERKPSDARLCSPSAPDFPKGISAWGKITKKG